MHILRVCPSLLWRTWLAGRAEGRAGGFAFRPIGLGNVELAVKHSSQACGEHGIPESWRRARLFALKKVSVPFTPSDFRPIALLCFLFKDLEKLAHDQMTSYLEENGLLDLIQTGFRKYNSTETVLIKLTSVKPLK